MKNLLVLSLLCLLTTAPAIAQERTWAAQANPHDHTSTSPVRWGATEKSAADAAFAACKSKCSKKPVTALTKEYNLLVRVCCTNPGTTNCIIVATHEDGNAGRQSSYDYSVNEIRDAGYGTSSCYIQSVFGVKTGKKLSNWQ